VSRAGRGESKVRQRFAIGRTVRIFCQRISSTCLKVDLRRAPCPDRRRSTRNRANAAVFQPPVPEIGGSSWEHCLTTVRTKSMPKGLVIGIAGAVLMAGAFGAGFLMRPRRPENQTPGKFPEQIVYVRSSDDVVSGGVLFSPPRTQSKPLAVIWVHGWGVNFYLPSYVGIGRALAEQGYPTISVNTRMHDLGNVEKYTSAGKRVRGGGYWGVTSEDARDIAAWIAYAEQLGYSRIVLVGHSAGWASVGRYQADSGDKRVAGLVFASGEVVGNLKGSGDPNSDGQDWIRQAQKLVDEGLGEDLLRIPNRPLPSFISAATELDMIHRPQGYADFFGTQTPNPPILRVSCPLLAFFGTKGDVGGEKELLLLKSSVQRLSRGPRSVKTAIISAGNHEYVGEEVQVAQTIAQWVEAEIRAR
jgi:pimeloyl-ACP methyl ester carboxylesterase